MFPMKVDGLIQRLTVIKHVTATLAGAGQFNVWYVQSWYRGADNTLFQYGFAQANFYRAVLAKLVILYGGSPVR
jgi:hypothetical protein